MCQIISGTSSFFYLIVSLTPDTNSLLVAPVELLAKAQSSHLELQRYKICFICGRSSSRLNRNTLRSAPRLHRLPAYDHPGGKPPLLPDRGA